MVRNIEGFVAVTSNGFRARGSARRRELLRCDASRPEAKAVFSSTQRLVLGSSLALVIAANRIAFTETLFSTQSRSDLLGLATAGLVALLGLSSAQVQSKVKEQVDVVGEPMDFLDKSMTQEDREELTWAANLFIEATNVCSVVVVSNGRTLLQRGVGGESGTPFQRGEIFDAALEAGKRTYMADMNTVLRKAEFTYLPPNVQAVLIQPVGEQSAIILGTDKARCFVGQDFGWMQAVFNRVAKCI